SLAKCNAIIGDSLLAKDSRPRRPPLTHHSPTHLLTCLQLPFGFLAMRTQLLSSEAREFTARAVLIGQRIDLRALGSTQRLGGGRLVVSVRGGGAAACVGAGVWRRGGVVSLWGGRAVRCAAAGAG